MSQGLVLKVELDVSVAIPSVSHEEGASHGGGCDRLNLLRLGELDLIDKDVAFVVIEEHLVREDLGPGVNKRLDDLLALLLS